MTDDALQTGGGQSPPLRVDFVDWGICLGRRTILSGINLSLIGPGVTVLMGPAGTGKSTLLKTLAGQRSAHAQTEGQILLHGMPLEMAGVPPSLAQQHPRELDLSVIDILIAAQRNDSAPLAPAQMRQNAIEALQACHQHALLPHLSTRLFDLPRQLMRCAQIMRAALSGSPVLLIDEPTADLDSAQSADVLALIRHLATTRLCVVVLHHQQQARELADHVVLLAGGRVQVAAPADAFFANADGHPVLAQFLRTGSCHVPSPDSRPEELEPPHHGPAEDVPGTEGNMPAGDLPPAKDTALHAATPAQLPVPAHVISADGNPYQSPGLIQPQLPAGVVPASRGPNGFHWLVPGKLAGCPMPGAMLPLEHDLALLRNVGVTVLINMTERPMTQAAIPAAGIRTLHMGVEDRNAPPLMWMKMLLVRIERLINQGEVVAVHCLAGLGRTGTVLGSWLVREGLTAEEALRRLRAIEPGFVQSAVQEQLLHELESNLLIRAPEL